MATDDEATISLTAPRQHPATGHWSNYVAGVIAGFVERGMRPTGFQAVIESSVPFGGGLSSSASLEVATATLLEAMTGTKLGLVAKALLCQKAEHEYAGVPCGIMDQFASVMGQEDHLMLLDCRSQQIEQIPLTDPAITVLIINTNVKHELSGGEYAERRGQCESAARRLGVASLRDATLAQLESQRSAWSRSSFAAPGTRSAKSRGRSKRRTAIKAGDWPRVGRLMYASHDSLRDDYEVSCKELDLLVDLARDLGTQRRRDRLADDRRRLRRLHGQPRGNGQGGRSGPASRPIVSSSDWHRARRVDQPTRARGACGAVGVKHTAAVLDMCDRRIQGHTYTQLLEPADLNCRSNCKEDERSCEFWLPAGQGTLGRTPQSYWPKAVTRL